MAFPYSVHKTYVTGEVLTASDLNATDVNHVNNNIPENTDDYSVNSTEMQSTVDPYPGSTESLATTLAGELERLRYQLKEILGESQWYIDPDGTIADVFTNTATFSGAKTFDGPSPAVTISNPTEATIDLSEVNNSVLVRGRATTGGSGSFIGSTTNHDFSLLANNVYGVTLDASDGSAVILKGTTAGGDAASGKVGEYIETVQSSLTNFPATATYGDLGSIALTAGDWDITYQLRGYTNGATWTGVLMGIGTVTGNDPTGLVFGDTASTHTWASGTTPENMFLTIAASRVSISSPTTYYAKVRSTYSSGQPQYTGRISARRIR